MFLVVGLGNPGDEYSLSRHNIGFIVVDELAKKLNVGLKKKGFRGLFAEATLDQKKLILFKPHTYMNRSGMAVKEAVDYFNISIGDVIVVQDEIDLPVGSLLIKSGGGSAGHKGIESIMTSLGDKGFVRLRIGVGKPDNKPEVTNYVLSKLRSHEREEILESIQSAVEAIIEVIHDGVQSAMNKFNKRSRGLRIA